MPIFACNSSDDRRMNTFFDNEFDEENKHEYDDETIHRSCISPRLMQLFMPKDDDNSNASVPESFIRIHPINDMSLKQSNDHGRFVRSQWYYKILCHSKKLRDPNDMSNGSEFHDRAVEGSCNKIDTISNCVSHDCGYLDEQFIEKVDVTHDSSDDQSSTASSSSHITSGASYKTIQPNEIPYKINVERHQNCSCDGVYGVDGLGDGGARSINCCTVLDSYDGSACCCSTSSKKVRWADDIGTSDRSVKVVRSIICQGRSNHCITFSSDGTSFCEHVRFEI